MTETFIKENSMPPREQPNCPTIENLNRARAIQIKAIEELSGLLESISGEDQKISQLPEWKGLVDLSLQLDAYSSTICSLVSECRRLIGG